MKIIYILLIFLFAITLKSQLSLNEAKNQSTSVEIKKLQINETDKKSVRLTDKHKANILTIPNSSISVDDWVGKYQILKPDDINPEIQSAYLRIKNSCNGEKGNRELEIISYSLPNNSNFKYNLPKVDEANPIKIGSEEKDFVFSASFSANETGDYQDTIIFTIKEGNNCDNTCILNIKAVASNIYLHQNDKGNEITDVVDFGTLTNNNQELGIKKIIKIANYPNNYGFGSILTIKSIDWGALSTIDSSELGNFNTEFYVNEEKMFEDLRQSGYPILIGIGQYVEVEVTYFTKQYDTEHRSIVTIVSDADESGNSGKFNNTITLVGNAKSSSVINNQITSNFYPNPANNTITFDKSIKGNIEVYNLLGEKVLGFDANLKSNFDISNLQNGVYIIKYKIDGQFYSEKLSVSR